jgi:hypothetical protein
LTTSVGFATEIPIAPVQRAANIFVVRVGFSPGFNSPAIMFLTGIYRPILRPAKINYLCKPAVKPLYKALLPSSFAMVDIVPKKPLYLSATLGSVYLPCT